MIESSHAVVLLIKIMKKKCPLRLVEDLLAWIWLQICSWTMNTNENVMFVLIKYINIYTPILLYIAKKGGRKGIKSKEKKNYQIKFKYHIIGTRKTYI